MLRTRLSWPILSLALAAGCGGDATGTLTVEVESAPLSLQFISGALSACDSAASICVNNGRQEAVELGKLEVQIALIGEDYNVGIPGNVFEVTQQRDDEAGPMTIAAGTRACIPINVCTGWAAWESRDPNGDGLALKDNAERTAVRLEVTLDGKLVGSNVSLASLGQSNVVFEGEVASAAP